MHVTRKKLVVFPNDPLLAYLNKGSIKTGYYNPQDWFDEVHAISMFGEETEVRMVQNLAGGATLHIHRFEKVNLANYKLREAEITAAVSGIDPMIIRAYNPIIQGWMAVRIAKKLGIPAVVSLHTEYDQNRWHARKHGEYFQFLKMKYAARLERFVLKNCDAVICVYEFIIPYAKKMGASNIELIYNKVDLRKFSVDAPKKFTAKKPTIISVSRLIEQKNRRHLVKSIKDLDVELLIIGDGPQLEELNLLIRSLNVEDKVRIIKRVPNEELPSYYTSSDIFALPLYGSGGIPIPFLEAMACGLPVVTTKHDDSYTEITDDAVVAVGETPEDLCSAFVKILENPDYRSKLISRSLDVVRRVSGDLMEEKELGLYKKLLKM